MRRNTVAVLGLFLLITYLGTSCIDKNTNHGALINPGSEEWLKEAPEQFNVQFSTTKGEFILEIHKAWAPIGINRFYNLVRLGYFDDSRFYRVREGYIVQFGIAGDPAIAQVWEHEAIKDDPALESNLKGYVTFAMTGLDTRTTQLFINYKDNIHLDEQGFAPLGLVVEGMDVLEQLYSCYDESAGGGMRGGKQERIFSESNTHLDHDYPKLDKLLKAEIVE